MSIVSKPLAKDIYISVPGIIPIKVAKRKLFVGIPKIPGIIFPNQIGRTGISLTDKSQEKGASLKFVTIFDKYGLASLVKKLDKNPLAAEKTTQQPIVATGTQSKIAIQPNSAPPAIVSMSTIGRENATAIKYNPQKTNLAKKGLVWVANLISR